jgi:hypothetical protein
MQVLGQRRRRRIPSLRFLLQTFQADRFQVARALRLQPAGRNRVVGHHLGQRVQGGLAAERRPARQHLIEDGAEGIHVGERAGGAALAAGLLRRHVRGRAQDGALALGQRRHFQPLRQPEIGDLRYAVGERGTHVPCSLAVNSGRTSPARPILGGQQHVGRRQVAVDDAALVRVADRQRQRPHQLRRRPRRLRFAGEVLGEAAAADPLQRQERPAVVLAHLVNLDDVGVLQPGDRLGFPTEACQLVGAGVGPGTQDLQRHHPVQGELPGTVDGAHAALADLLQDLVTRDHRPAPRRGRDRHRLGGVGRRQRRSGVEGRAGSQRLIDLELHPQLLGQVGEALLVLGQRRRLAPLLAEEELLVDQIEDGLGIGRRVRQLLQQGFDRHSLAALPALPLFRQQGGQCRIWSFRGGCVSHRRLGLARENCFIVRQASAAVHKGVPEQPACRRGRTGPAAQSAKKIRTAVSGRPGFGIKPYRTGSGWRSLTPDSSPAAPFVAAGRKPAETNFLAASAWGCAG